MTSSFNQATGPSVTLCKKRLLGSLSPTPTALHDANDLGRVRHVLASPKGLGKFGWAPRGGPPSSPEWTPATHLICRRQTPSKRARMSHVVRKKSFRNGPWMQDASFKDRESQITCFLLFSRDNHPKRGLLFGEAPCGFPQGHRHLFQPNWKPIFRTPSSIEETTKHKTCRFN